jgi:hypothetical protein
MSKDSPLHKIEPENTFLLGTILKIRNFSTGRNVGLWSHKFQSKNDCVPEVRLRRDCS